MDTIAQPTSTLIRSGHHPRGWYPMAGRYLRNWQAARAAFTAGHKNVTICWPGGFPCEMDARQFSRWIRGAFDRRINAKGGIEGTGRKWADDYQSQLSRDARATRASPATGRTTWSETGHEARFARHFPDPRVNFVVLFLVFLAPVWAGIARLLRLAAGLP